MAVKKDKVQIEVEINGEKAANTYKDLKKNAKDLNRELNLLEPGTDAFVKKAAELKAVNTQLGEIRKQTSGVTKAMDEARSSGGGLVSTFKNFLPALGVGAIVAGLGSMLGSLVEIGKESIGLFNIQAKADAQLKATLQSTSQAAGRSFEQLKAQASELQGITLFGDEATQEAQALLLTFTNVREEIFDRSIPAIQDIATAMKTDLAGASQEVGEILNSPIDGLETLSKFGITFPESQKKVIESLVNTGKVSEAQEIILGKLEERFKGSAEAAALAGTGGITQLENKLGDVKEVVGSLIIGGLNRLAPALNFVVDFTQKFVDTLLSGESATGRFSTAVNGIIFGLQTLTLGVRIAYNLFLAYYENILKPFGSLILSVINPALDFLAEKFGFLGGQLTIFTDLVEDVGATFAGFSAAAKQAIDNIADYFSGLLLSARITAKELDLALSFRSGTKERLRSELTALRSEQAQLASESGKTIGEAYTEARAAAIKAQEPQRLEEEKQFAQKAAEQVAQTVATVTEQALATAREKAKEQSALDAVRAAQSAFGDVASLGSSAPPGSVSSQPNAASPSGNINEDEALRNERLRAAFQQAIITEQEYEQLRLDNQAAAIERRLELMRLAGESETAAFAKLQNDLTAVQEQQDEKRLENTRRTEELRDAVLQQGAQTARSLLDVGIALLSKDQEARKKHASAIKAFEVAKVGVNLAAEISGIWKNASSNPLNALIPGFGAILGVAQTAAAVLRSGVQVRNINAQQFAKGGFTGDGYGNPDSTGFKPAGFVHEGEYVVPKWMVETYKPTIKGLEGVRQRGYADGGLVGVDTTPRGNFLSDASFIGQPGAAGNGVNIDAAVAAESSMAVVERLDVMIAAFQDFPRTFKGYVSYDDIEAAGSEKAQGIAKSSL